MVGDVVKSHQRAQVICFVLLRIQRCLIFIQAISFLRFVGDVGFLLGAAFSGVIGQLTSIETTMQLNSAFIGVGIAVFLFRRRKTLKV